ncbi:hypothetical protein [Streptomyces sp. NPDC091259]|uniref:MBL fold metallo-hydrolase n=1 Tax=Streptomyces sp. NPDC091259 TaxID=3365976 RepID=UPI0019CF512B
MAVTPVKSQPLTGQVVGSVLTGESLPTIYVSGDNGSLDLVKEVTHRFGPVGTTILYTGSPVPVLFDGALVLLDRAQAADATRILGARRVLPVPYDSWAHFTEGRDEPVAFTEAGPLDRLDFGDRA